MAAWTYAALATAIAALPAATQGAGLAAVAAALNAQTTTLTSQPFSVHQAKLIAQESGNFSWAKILQRAEATAAIPPASATDAAILAARTITSMGDTQSVDPTVASAWAAWQAGIGALVAVGDLTAADAAAIGALTSVTVPAWAPAVTAGDVQTAEAQK